MIIDYLIETFGAGWVLVGWLVLAFIVLFAGLQTRSTGIIFITMVAVGASFWYLAGGG